MSRSHRLVLVVAGVTVVLAGCAAPAATPTAEPTVPVATPSATPEPVAQPGPRTPLGCAELAAGGGVDEILVGEARLDAPQPLSVFTASQAQSGVLRCSWGVGDNRLSIVIAPLDLFATVPDDRVDCNVSSGFAVCQSGQSLELFRLESHLSSVTGGAPAAEARSRFDALLAAVAANADAAGILPAWQSPELSTASYGDCSALASAEITATLHPLEPAANGDSGDGFASVYRGMEEAGYNGCTFAIAHPDYPLPVQASFTVDYVAGGGWAWPLTDGDPIEVAGADEAVTRCLVDGYCQVDARVGDTWVSGQFGDSEYDLATAARYLAAVIPSLPIEERS